LEATVTEPPSDENPLTEPSDILGRQGVPRSVLYLLQGIGGNERDWGGALHTGTIIDKLHHFAQRILK
jgi:hypothetical protein